MQAGALDLLCSERSNLAPFLLVLSNAIDTGTVAYAAERGITLDPAVPPLVALDFAARSAFLVAPPKPVPTSADRTSASSSSRRTSSSGPPLSMEPP